MFERLAYALDWYWFSSYTPRDKKNGSKALHRHRMALTDYSPELIPVLHDYTDAGIRRRAIERRGGEAREKSYLDKSGIDEVVEQ